MAGISVFVDLPTSIPNKKKPASEPTEAGFISEGQDLIWKDWELAVAAEEVESRGRNRRKRLAPQQPRPLR